MNLSISGDFMGHKSRVIWSEGMFLRPQHFQQHDRHIENWIDGRCHRLQGFDWGFSVLTLEKGAGKLGVTACRGRFQDGTPFQMPVDDPLPLAITIPDDFKNGLVYLALPARRVNASEIDSHSQPDSLARYRQGEFEARDHNSGADGACPVKVGYLQAVLMLEGDPRVRLGHSCLPIARILEVKSDKTLVMDDSFIPPSLNCSASLNLGRFLRELQTKLHVRGEALAENTVEAARLGGAGVANFILLQTINRYEPLLNHLESAVDHVRPEDFYRIGLQLAGDLSTFFKKRPISFPLYHHDDLKFSFGPLMAELGALLDRGIGTNTVRITLMEWKDGIDVTPNRLEYIHLLDKALFVLGVKAGVPSEILRTRFSQMVKVGPGEEIQQIVSHALLGIELSPLMQLPPTLPSRPEFCYFGLSKQGEYWKKMSNSKGFAFYIGGHFPDLELEFWAVQG